jgi:hypothetical protein
MNRQIPEESELKGGSKAKLTRHVTDVVLPDMGANRREQEQEWEENRADYEVMEKTSKCTVRHGAADPFTLGFD